MGYGEAVLLGLLQGIAEFLPISSSGHLAIGHHLLGPDKASSAENLFFDVMLHLGTALVVVLHYRRAMGRYLAEC